MTNHEISEAEFDAACERAADLLTRRVAVRPNGPMGATFNGVCSGWATDGQGGITVTVDVPDAAAVDGYRQVEAWLGDVAESGPVPNPTLARLDAYDASLLSGATR